jgi:sulfite exporter TauE/SafE/copper chaperone CopZ
MAKPDLKSASFRIGGMTCVNCRNRIEKKLKSTVGVEDAAVNFNTGTAAVTWNASVLSLNEIKAAIETLDYRVLDNRASPAAASVREITGTLVIMLALYVLVRGLGIGVPGPAFPLAESGMGYGMLFIIGLVTSAHCAAMCGGINLSQCIPSPPAPVPEEAGLPAGRGGKVLFPALLYNAGRVVSYTVLGALAGALGSAVTLSGRFQGLVQLAAGLFMVIMGINMLGFFPFLRRLSPRFPKIFARKLDGRRGAGGNPLFIGLLNGFMPCGPLQAMQLYALSTGSPLSGAVSLFLFSMGTVPLMFGIGALGSLLGNTVKGPGFRRRVTRAGAILITVMGMTMFTYGFNLSGFSLDFAAKAIAAPDPFAPGAGRRGGASAPAAEASFHIEKGVQIVNSTLSGGRYPAITVQAGIPVKWTIDAPGGSINGCNNRMIIREYGIEHRFRPGENVIAFTPARPGKFPYSCWMGMIRSSITVVDEKQSPADTGGSGLPSPAGVAIPTGSVVLAEIGEDGSWQTVTTRLRDEGIDPPILVMQRGLRAVWTVNNDSLDPGNSSLLFPAYRTRLNMEGGDNIIRLMPAEDFDFSTADNVFYGYVKVTEDLRDVDIEAIKAEVSGHETLIYPDTYFEAAARDGFTTGSRSLSKGWIKS